MSSFVVWLFGPCLSENNMFVLQSKPGPSLARFASPTATKGTRWRAMQPPSTAKMSSDQHFFLGFSYRWRMVAHHGPGIYAHMYILHGWVNLVRTCKDKGSTLEPPEFFHFFLLSLRSRRVPASWRGLKARR